MRDEQLKHFPDIGTLIAYMDRARETGQEDLRAQYNFMYERSHSYADGWSTHLPLLASVIATAKKGPVLEVGVGRGSSPLVVEMCRAMGRDLIGLDSEQAWLNEMCDLPYPTLEVMPDWAKFPSWIAKRNFAVAFVDHGPGEARLPVVKALRGHADYVVVHDTYNPGYMIGLDAELDTWKYRADYKLMASCTSVVSDVKPYAGAT